MKRVYQAAKTALLENIVHTKKILATAFLASGVPTKTSRVNQPAKIVTKDCIKTRNPRLVVKSVKVENTPLVSAPCGVNASARVKRVCMQPICLYS